MTLQNKSARPKAPARRRLLPMDAVLRRLTERDLQILQALYVGRSLGTRQICIYFWGLEWATEQRQVPACRRRLRYLRDWGLIQQLPVRRSAYDMIGSWDEVPHFGALSDWGQAAVITGRGINVLKRMNLVPADDELLERQGYSKAWQLRPAPTRFEHTLMISGAVLRSAGDMAGYNWFDGRALARAVDDDGQVIPDALLQTEHLAWAIEADTGSLHVPTLLERWERQVPLWENALQRGGLNLVGASPVAGVLWYCSHVSATRLRTRVMRLRHEAGGRLMLPANFGWYVDSFDGLCWTFRYWLGPWSKGEAPSPQERLARAVMAAVGRTDLVALATLGNITAWQQLYGWAAQMQVEQVEQRRSYCVALVRDWTEAEQLWSLVESTGMTEYLAFVIPNRATPYACLDLRAVHWRPGPEFSWQSVPLSSLISGSVRPIERRKAGIGQ